jgi:hypothetical protein
MYKIAFELIEATAFILPAIPNNFCVRFSILTIYFVGYYFKLQLAYSKLKNKYIHH